MPESRSREIMPSTWADICTPSAAVGSSSSSIRGAAAIALATATSWRWPPDSERTLRVVSCSGMPSRSSSRMASVCIRTSDRSCRRRSRPSIRLAAMSRLSHSARSCQTTPTPCRDSTDGSAGMTLPASRMDPVVGSMSPPMHRTSVVLPAPFSPARATISPSPTVRLTPSRARTGP